MRLSDERGTTLVELIVAMVVSVVVLFAIFATVDYARTSAAVTSDRVETLQRGRLGMERVTQLLRSASCPENGDQPAFTETGPTRVGFHSKLGPDATLAETALVRKRVLRLEGGTLWEDVYTLSSGGPDEDLVYAATPASSRRLLERVRPIDGTTAFRYLHAVDAEITDPALRPKARAVSVELLVLPTRANAAIGTPFRTTVALRTDDITDLDQEPQC
jgi:Tfp pilus assembly protein PilV